MFIIIIIVLDCLAYITWNVRPEIVEGFNVRWYGLLFALAFLFGQLILGKIFKIEGKPAKDLEKVSIYVMIATVVGARLGHILFYQPAYYLSNPLEIFKIWNGGLASHGAAIGILLALYWFALSKKDQSFLWIVDRIVIVVALGAFFIRLGNLMNSEIIGEATTLPWAFIFTRVDSIPRHPAQLYEALSSLLIFFSLLWVYNRKKQNTPEGLLTGIFMISIFTLRFFYEFIKENQVSFEEGMTLNMGQLLSIPIVILGFAILLYSKKKVKSNHTL